MVKEKMVGTDKENGLEPSFEIYGYKRWVRLSPLVLKGRQIGKVGVGLLAVAASGCKWKGTVKFDQNEKKNGKPPWFHVGLFGLLSVEALSIEGFFM